MRTWYITWTYIANFSTHIQEQNADNAEEAVKLAFRDWSEEFKSKATFIVTDKKPTIIKAKDIRFKA